MTTAPVKFAVLSLVISSFALPGCAKRPALTQASAPAPTGVVAPTLAAPTPPPLAVAPRVEERPVTPAPVTPAPVTPPPPPPAALQPSASAPTTPTPPPPREFAANLAIEAVYFEFDKYNIRPGDARVLERNAQWLKSNPDTLVLIEGHCDERGTNEYNLALGDRRAKSAMNYLVSQGIQVNRITTISYGEDRPTCSERSEQCWGKNRRAQFLVKPR